MTNAAANKPKKLSRQERESILILKHKFENRITIARYGKEAFDAGDYGNSLKKFTEYLNIIAKIQDVKDLYSVQVNKFDPKEDITEMLMISHIYFEMARMYDAVPKFHEESKRCLAQFVLFTASQPYQVVNSEMLRKYIKKSSFKNPTDFAQAYQQIHVQSKKCYVVTYCFGDDHSITHECREFKDWLLTYTWGQRMVQTYYQFSSTAVDKWGNETWALALSRYIMRPLLVLFSKTILPVIIKKC